jgi:cellulose synthase/poly-beta-1,6-N-acetylglucosamine synthase-like glycosyltransferase
MESICLFLVALSTLSWIVFALIPWRPWANREVLDARGTGYGDAVLKDITVVIPARNEADVIRQTLRSIIDQGPGLSIILVDDHSKDSTAEKAGQMRISSLRIVQSLPLPTGWSGKLWALEQGRRHVATPYT